jgi:hypothetical protein
VSTRAERRARRLARRYEHVVRHLGELAQARDEALLRRREQALLAAVEQLAECVAVLCETYRAPQRRRHKGRAVG